MNLSLSISRPHNDTVMQAQVDKVHHNYLTHSNAPTLLRKGSMVLGSDVWGCNVILPDGTSSLEPGSVHLRLASDAVHSYDSINQTGLMILNYSAKVSLNDTCARFAMTALMERAARRIRPLRFSL